VVLAKNGVGRLGYLTYFDTSKHRQLQSGFGFWQAQLKLNKKKITKLYI
jgi:hypothetical protein